VLPGLMVRFTALLIAAPAFDFFAWTATAPRSTFPELTDREREILALVAEGRSNEQIANRLTLSLKTIRNHVSNIFNKLQVPDRAAAIAKAREAGLGVQPLEASDPPT
ncbi:MAG TPA: helix-turn-helix transcriptional regulator, partial [Solirubrobacterales bacterium]|nr:helix-turn-helix transcriptional regulator [Solirubrobacterales bacterium]